MNYLDYTDCRIRGHHVEFKMLSSGCISVGVDDVLVGVSSPLNDAEAAVIALERVRLMEGDRDRPLIPGRIRKDLRQMVASHRGEEDAE